MKIHLKFEKSDLEEMLTEYFSSRGFDLLNLPEVVEQFDKAWETGLEVAATTRPVPAPAATQPAAPREPVATRSGSLPDTELVAGDLPEPGPTGASNNPRMSADDLFDPNGPRKAPTAEQILEETQRELQSILAQSSEIASKKPRKER